MKDEYEKKIKSKREKREREKEREKEREEKIVSRTHWVPSRRSHTSDSPSFCVEHAMAATKALAICKL